MNCFNHTNDPAVAQCTACGKGLCYTCSNMYKPVLCSSCFSGIRRNEIKKYSTSLIIFAVLFIIGYSWETLLPGKALVQRCLAGYVMISLWSGCIFIERILPYKLLSGSTATWLFYWGIKLMLYVIVGFFAAPFSFLWCLYRLIRAICLKP